MSFTTTPEAFRCASCGKLTFSEDAVSALCDAVVAASVPGPQSFRLVRKHLGVSGTELARLIDTTRFSVTRWEHGKRPIPRSARAILAMLWLQRGGQIREVLERMAGPKT